MILEYSIVGGYMQIQKNVFIQEMLGKDSLLRSLLNWKSTKDFSVKHPNVGEPKDDNIITVKFDSETIVNLNESPKELLGALKAKYKEKIKGKVACRSVYGMFGGIFTFEVDLNSDNGEIDYSGIG